MRTHPRTSIIPSAWTLTTSRTVLTMAVALWLTVFANFSLWRTVWQGVGGWSNGNPLFLLSLPVFVWFCS